MHASTPVIAPEDVVYAKIATQKVQWGTSQSSTLQKQQYQLQ
jgi:hypothetical protein